LLSIFQPQQQKEVTVSKTKTTLVANDLATEIFSMFKKKLLVLWLFSGSISMKERKWKAPKTIEGEPWLSLGRPWTNIMRLAHTGNGLGSVHHQHHAFALIYSLRPNT
jgi:hypothetical protein